MAEKLAVCIARQFGSGGREVGLELAKMMGIPFYDKELLAHAARESGIMHELFEKNDEKPAPGTATRPEGQKAASYEDYISYVPSERIHTAVDHAIRGAAGGSDCVIIGRCADHVLRGQKGRISVFVHAPLEVRVHRIARMHNLDEDAARALIRKTDRGRASYYLKHTGREWANADNYDIALDAGRLSVEACAAILKTAVPLFLPQNG